MFPDFVNASVITQNMQDFTPPHITVVWKAIPGCVEGIIEGDLLLSVEDTVMIWSTHEAKSRQYCSLITRDREKVYLAK